MDSNEEKSGLVHDFPVTNKVEKKENDDFIDYKRVTVIFLATIVIGALSGFMIKYAKEALGPGNAEVKKTTATEVKEAVGIPDKKTFKDSAEGKLQEGGLDGEGSFHLVRPGGESQNVYLTSSTVDLSEYVGSEIIVHGETFESDKAGWLMDVGYVEILE